MPERTPAQRYADYKKTLPKRVNARRLELIEKKYSGFTKEESCRRFDLDPAWKVEPDRRMAANLTPEEEAELAECERIMDEWSARAPWNIERQAMLDELEADIEELKARKRKEAP